jgi:hypothetical protein
MDDRKNRSIPVLMADGVSILGAHNRPYWRMVWLPLWILARSGSLSHRDASHFFPIFLDTVPDAPYD